MQPLGGHEAQIAYRATLAKAIKAIEERLEANDFKPTMGDYLKLLQLEHEIEEEPPKEIKVTWVEPSGIRIREIAYDPLPSQKSVSRFDGAVQGFSGPIGCGQEPGAVPGSDQAELSESGADGAAWERRRIRCCGMPRRRRCSRFWKRTRIPYEQNKAENMLTMKDTGSRILFRPVDEFERLRGTNLAWFGLDELTYTQEAAWLRLEGRLRDPQGAAAVRVRGVDAEGVRLGVPEVHGGAGERVTRRSWRSRSRTGYLLEKVPDFYERLKKQLRRDGSTSRKCWGST